MRRPNVTGYTGISVKKNGRFTVAIQRYGRKFYIGSYENLQEAVRAYTCAEVQYPRAEKTAFKKKVRFRDNHPYPFIREYTNTTDKMIVIMLNEGGSIEDIANLLKRPVDCLEQHIAELKKTNRFEAIHRHLIKCAGAYARHMARKRGA